MKVFVLVLAFFGISQFAFSDVIDPSEAVFNGRFPSGSGFDKEIIQLHADTNDFEDGVYYLRVNVRERRLVNYRLPRVTYTHYCGHYRTSGGSVGDYKPKNIADKVGIRDDRDGFVYNISWEGALGQDYNETPVVKTFEHHPRGTKLFAESGSEQMNLLINACRRVRPVPKVTLVWNSHTSCRWKPEIWHKPARFRDEYTPPLEAAIVQQVVLHCVNF